MADAEWKKKVESSIERLADNFNRVHVGRMKQQTPKRFDHTDDGIAYIKHFEIIAKCNDWTDEERLKAFPTYLDAISLDWYLTLSTVIHNDYQQLVRAFTD